MESKGRLVFSDMGIDRTIGYSGSQVFPGPPGNPRESPGIPVTGDQWRIGLWLVFAFWRFD
eukprot:1375147-Amorphochlora_amoeboformis.AAC.1